MTRGKFPLITALGLLVAPAAQAQTATTTLDVLATLDAHCTVSATALAFGATPEGLQANGEGTITVRCTSLVPYTIALDAGLAAACPRGMFDDPDASFPALPYFLYQDAARTVEWGDDGVTCAPTSKADTGNGADQLHTVFGRHSGISSGSPVGNFSDTVTVTVTF